VKNKGGSNSKNKDKSRAGIQECFGYRKAPTKWNFASRIQGRRTIVSTGVKKVRMRQKKPTTWKKRAAGGHSIKKKSLGKTYEPKKGITEGNRL